MKARTEEIFEILSLFFPIGAIYEYPGETEPTNFMFTNGQALKKDEYPELYAIIGDKYRKEDNNDETTFNLPDKGERVSIQANDKY